MALALVSLNTISVHASCPSEAISAWINRAHSLNHPGVPSHLIRQVIIKYADLATHNHGPCLPFTCNGEPSVPPPPAPHRRTATPNVITRLGPRGGEHSEALPLLFPLSATVASVHLLRGHNFYNASSSIMLGPKPLGPMHYFVLFRQRRNQIPLGATSSQIQRQIIKHVCLSTRRTLNLYL
jgi:hypothetical protein